MGKTDKTLADFIGSKRIGSNQLRAMGLPEWLPQSSVDPTAPVLPYGSSGEVQTVYFPIADMISGTIGAGVKEATGSDKLGFAAEMIAPSPTQIVKGLTKLGKPMMSEMTTWHGSPHKLDPEQLVRLPSGKTAYVGGKYNPLQEVPAGATVLQDFPAGRFRKAAVGTGEGAQAYGHGAAYLAESKDVASQYAEALDPLAQAARSGLDAEGTAARVLQAVGYDKNKAIKELISRKNADHVKGNVDWAAKMDAAIAHIKGISNTSNLYKTDIPDEAVARMLDWDKPLSEQAPEVQAVARKRLDELRGMGGSFPQDPTGEWLYKAFGPQGAEKAQNGLFGQSAASARLQQSGIPGIKYLDMVSRGRAGGELIDVSQSGGQWFSKIRKDKISGQINDVIPQGSQVTTSMPFKTESEARQWAQQQITGGTSNFVPFDEDLIRILERNGIPTGAQPWKPGEWQGLGSRVEQTAAPYSLGDVTHGLPSNIPAAAPRVIDDNALRSLRSQATGLENASKGISLYITHDGKAIVSKPQGVKTPDRLKKFAAEHGLEYSEGTWRWPVSKSHPLYETAMPVEYRESGAKYHWE